MLQLSANDKQLQHIISQSGIIAYPTEAIYGLGCHPCDKKAVKRLVTLKKRDIGKGFILIAADLAQLSPYVLIDKTTEAYLHSIYPAFITVIVNQSEACPKYLSGQHNGIAIRISNHPIVQTLCQQLGHPLISTSANFSGKAPITDKNQLINTFTDTIDALVLGELGGAIKPSQIIDLTGKQKKIIRE